MLRQYHKTCKYWIKRSFVRSQSNLLKKEREVLEYDVVLVGGGPASFSAAIRLKQLCQQHNKDLSVCVIDKGKEIGSHILSGNILEPTALNELIPDWKTRGAPLTTPVKENKFSILLKNKSIPVPSLFFPTDMRNDGNYVISLSHFVRWLAEEAEKLGVEVYPGFSASEVLFNKEKNAVIGIATSDMGVDKDGTLKETFQRGVEMRAKYTLFGEGCRGSCSEYIMKTFNLRKGCQNQKYGLGIKEVWEIPEKQARPGYVQHYIGWPLQTSPFSKIYGGSFIYHMQPNIVHIGTIVGLDYENPYLEPYEEFQKFKTHPDISKHIQGGQCISYGARCLNEGGLHSIPKLSFPGGALIGCSAGFLNVVKIKGTHTAMKSGMLAAESVYEKLVDETHATEPGLENYELKVRNSWIHNELYRTRNCHASFHYGMLAGLTYSGISSFLTKGREPWTLDQGPSDSSCTKVASGQDKPRYPRHDNSVTFDLLTNLQRSGTSHDEQPSHLRIKPDLKYMAEHESYDRFKGVEEHVCPARVYEFVGEGNKKRLVINSENCLHCKACSIKAPKEYIDWNVPEGGGGPL